MDELYMEVFFNKYCKTCKYRKVDGDVEPCNECLEHPVNLYSHKPVKWENKDETDN